MYHLFLMVHAGWGRYLLSLLDILAMGGALSSDSFVFKCFQRSLPGEERSRELISALSTCYSIPSDHLLAAMRDRASVNNVAMCTLCVFYPLTIDIVCFSHTFNHVGENFVTPILAEFTSCWINACSHSYKTKMLWRYLTGSSMPSYSNTKWWSRWEVQKVMMVRFSDMQTLLVDNENVGLMSRQKLLYIFTDNQKHFLLQLELAVTIDYGEPFVKACYQLEGDGPLALTCYEVINRVSASIHAAHTPNVNAVVQRLSGTNTTLSVQLCDYARTCVQPGLGYWKQQLDTI